MISFQIWIAIKKTYKSWAQGPGIITSRCYSPICWSSSKVLLVVESYLNITLIILETWEMHTDDDTGKAYYFNSITKETTWESPVIKRRSNLSAKVSKFHNKDVLCVPFFILLPSACFPKPCVVVWFASPTLWCSPVNKFISKQEESAD